MRAGICSFLMLIVLGSAAQTVSGLTTPNWLSLTETDTRSVSNFASFNDIAALGECRALSASVSAERRILQADLQYIYGSISFPMTHAGAGITVSHASLDAWTQSKLGLAYGRKLGTNFSLAIQLNYHRISFGGYGSAGTLTPAAGMRFLLAAKTVFTVFADNPYGGNLGRSKEKIGSLFTAMLASNVSDKAALALKLIRQQFTPADLCILLNYGMNSKLHLDGGISLNRGNGFVGTSIAFRQIRLRQIISWSQVYGFGTAVIFEYRKPARDD